MVTRSVLTAIDDRLESVSDALSLVPDSDSEWNNFVEIQGWINEARERVGNMLDTLDKQEKS